MYGTAKEQKNRNRLSELGININGTGHTQEHRSRVVGVLPLLAQVALYLIFNRGLASVSQISLVPNENNFQVPL